MSFRRLTKVCAFLLTGLAAVASAALVAYEPQSAARQERLIPVEVTQLPAESGAFPVELRCGEGRSTAPNRMDGFSCLVINNTGKKISALSLIYSVVVADAGGEARETSLLTNDFAIHPDVADARRQKLLSPGESYRVGHPGWVAFESGTVTGVEIHIDYVEFEDKTSAGRDTQGSKTINSWREGAARYKAWLVRQYKRGGADERTMAALLEATDLPRELNFDGSGSLGSGARFYRDSMRVIYASHGTAGLKRYLDK